MKKLFLLLIVLGLTCAAFAAPAKTMANLQAAYNGEMNANATYAAYATQAEKDGYPGVATLFRAQAKAEEIHAANFAKTIKTLGAEPKFTLATIDVKTTKDNLINSLRSEDSEIDHTYNEALQTAHLDKCPEAVTAFVSARVAEEQHAKLLKQAIKNLPKSKGMTAKYYVCPDCGYTTAKLPKDCPTHPGQHKEFIVVG